MSGVTVYRVIASRYPQISLFERVASAQDFELLYAVESLTNPRLRDEVGDVRMVAPADRVYGDGASCIMGAFTHPPVSGQGGRFNADFGVFYCSKNLTVAIAESTYHRARFLADAGIETTQIDMRVIRATLDTAVLDDLRHHDRAIYHPTDYSASQLLGRRLRDGGSYGVHYRSVRSTGDCIGVMRPPVLAHARHWRYLRYHFSGGAIAQVESI